MKNGVSAIAIVLLIVILITGCGSDTITKNELKIIRDVIPNIDKDDIKPIKLSDNIIEKFSAVKKVFRIKNADGNDYAFMVVPVGFRGHINTVVIIDGEQNQVRDVKIIDHEETLIYAESLTEGWFLDRFKGKSIKEYLQRVVLEANKPNEVIQITAATISTQALINGVNSAIGAYRELVLNETAEPVPLKVEEFVTGVE
ncbi:MAG: FMN-binding protein [Natronincolaceae bacterium]|nr:FMN-binding protein [Bacillota bacterium]NLK90741.1 FMN-binding protein [Clostridiales bacterium]